jgi:hypothetical protein
VVAGGDADQGGGDVVGGVERECELRRTVGAVPGCEQLGRAEDQQGGRDVAHLERGDGTDQASEVASEDGA